MDIHPKVRCSHHFAPNTASNVSPNLFHAKDKHGSKLAEQVKERNEGGNKSSESKGRKGWCKGDFFYGSCAPCTRETFLVDVTRDSDLNERGLSLELPRRAKHWSVSPLHPQIPDFALGPAFHHFPSRETVSVSLSAFWNDLAYLLVDLYFPRVFPAALLY